MLVSRRLTELTPRELCSCVKNHVQDITTPSLSYESILMKSFDLAAAIPQYALQTKPSPQTYV